LAGRDTSQTDIINGLYGGLAGVTDVVSAPATMSEKAILFHLRELTEAPDVRSMSAATGQIETICSFLD
jgi:hypothetical protein